ncbi:MAG: pilus assembly PilX N-terminal domain-containing protein [Candidatus Binatia bacterium]
MTQRGTALVVTLGIIMVLLPLGAYLVLQCRTDLMIQRNFRNEVEAFYVAEAGLEHAVAEIRPDQSFDEVLAGPDGVAGTADDGLFPFSEGATRDFPYSPFHYDVQVTRTATNSLSILSRATGKDGATKVVGALVSRSPLAFTPAALYVQSNMGRMELGTGTFLLSGFDHGLGDAPENASGIGAPVPALGGPNRDAESALRNHLPGESAQRFLGAGGPPSIVVTPPFDAGALASRFADQPQCARFGAVTCGESMGLGTPQVPQISVVTGDVDVQGRFTGNGILIVHGTLHVSGTFDFTGIVIAMGGLVFDSSSNVEIAGALWQGVTEDERLRLLGTGAIMYSSRALAGVDDAFPGLLPHAAVVTGWVEEL